jgi:circadian clock protein KaiC
MDRISTGNAELDRILGGGLPRGSLVVLAGSPGSGKTILAQQVCFANGSAEHPAVYYTTLSEPHSKMIRHLESFDFFDKSKLGQSVEFNHLTSLSGTGDLDAAVSEVVKHSFDVSPSVVVIDSTKALHEAMGKGEDFRAVVYDLASRIAHTDSVLIFVGEYSLDDVVNVAEFAVADAIVYLANEATGTHDERWLRVAKLRGSEYLSGMHSFRITPRGLSVFPRPEKLSIPQHEVSEKRISSGVPGLDQMIGGGIPSGSISLVAGPSGGGKTVLGLHFIVEGLARGERCLYASFQETAAQLIAKARAFGWDLERAISEGRLQVLHIQPVEMTLDEVGSVLLGSVDELSRIVIDSMGELQQAARGSDRFPDYLWALMSGLRSRGASIFLTSETAAFFGPTFELARGLSFVVDNVILLRYTEIESEIRRALSIVKMRESDHVKSLVVFEIGGKGAQVKGKFAGVSGVLTGTPVRTEERFREFFNR